MAARNASVCAVLNRDLTSETAKGQSCKENDGGKVSRRPSFPHPRRQHNEKDNSREQSLRVPGHWTVDIEVPLTVDFSLSHASTRRVF